MTPSSHPPTRLALACALALLVGAVPALASAQMGGDTGTPPPGKRIYFEEEAGQLGTLGWIGGATLLVGLGGILGAGVIESDVDADFVAYRGAAATANAQRYYQLEEDIEDKQAIGQVLLFSGIGLAAAGATMIAVDFWGDEEPEPVRVDAGASSEAAQVRLGIDF